MYLHIYSEVEHRVCLQPFFWPMSRQNVSTPLENKRDPLLQSASFFFFGNPQDGQAELHDIFVTGASEILLKG